MRFFKPIKQNEIKESKQEIQKNITSKDLQEQHRKAINRYRRFMKEYDEEQTPEKYKELIEVHTELKSIEKQIEELKLQPNKLTDEDFNIKSEDINQPNKSEIISEIKQTEEKEEMITGDDGISRPKSMHDQIESNKCLFCEEKFGFTQDWNIHMINKHPEELVEYNKKEIEKLESETIKGQQKQDTINDEPRAYLQNESYAKEDELDNTPEEIIHENLSNTEIQPKNTYDMKKEDPDLYVIQEMTKSKNVQSKEEYDVMMDEAEKDSPYAILDRINPQTDQTKSYSDGEFGYKKQNELKEIAEKLEILKKPTVPTEAIVDLKEIIADKKPKIKFELSKIFQKKKFSKLKGIEAYCNICKHTVQQHEYQGKSEGCVKCGCLKTVQEILEINEVDLHYGEEKPIVDNGIYCVCGHSELTHKDHAKFCEVSECHCVRFRTK